MGNALGMEGTGLMVSDIFVACYVGWSFYQKGGKCYKFYSELVTSDKAVRLCQAAAPNDSGNLASVTSQEIVQFISNLGLSH